MIKIRPEDNIPIADVPKRALLRVDKNAALYDVLSLFKSGKGTRDTEMMMMITLLLRRPRAGELWKAEAAVGDRVVTLQGGLEL